MASYDPCVLGSFYTASQYQGFPLLVSWTWWLALSLKSTWCFTSILPTLLILTQCNTPFFITECILNNIKCLKGLCNWNQAGQAHIMTVKKECWQMFGIYPSVFLCFLQEVVAVKNFSALVDNASTSIGGAMGQTTARMTQMSWSVVSITTNHWKHKQYRATPV